MVWKRPRLWWKRPRRLWWKGMRRCCLHGGRSGPICGRMGWGDALFTQWTGTGIAFKGLSAFLHQSILTSERVTALQNSPRSWGVKSGSAREIHSHYTPLPPLFLANFNWPLKDQLGHRFSQVVPIGLDAPLLFSEGATILSTKPFLIIW